MPKRKRLDSTRGRGHGHKMSLHKRILNGPCVQVERGMYHRGLRAEKKHENLEHRKAELQIKKKIC